MGRRQEVRQPREAQRVTSEPIPHWPGEMVSLGDHEVNVRSITPDDQAEPALCVHGLEGSSRNWTDLMGLLTDRKSVG